MAGTVNLYVLLACERDDWCCCLARLCYNNTCCCTIVAEHYSGLTRATRGVLLILHLDCARLVASYTKPVRGQSDSRLYVFNAEDVVRDDKITCIATNLNICWRGNLDRLSAVILATLARCEDKTEDSHGE